MERTFASMRNALRGHIAWLEGVVRMVLRSSCVKRATRERMRQLSTSYRQPEPLWTAVRKSIDNLLNEYSKSFGADALEKRSC